MPVNPWHYTAPEIYRPEKLTVNSPSTIMMCIRCLSIFALLPLIAAVVQRQYCPVDVECCNDLRSNTDPEAEALAREGLGLEDLEDYPGWVGLDCQPFYGTPLCSEEVCCPGPRIDGVLSTDCYMIF
ncbi:hypothetical protein BDN72DRAFT_163501 [Pluteus cervinus]|uniref:Uncharacterized protein n=1 Tax=Pluteus cervinus TaxID=181527 RepID=A0ACD3AJJ4_9AGAR|nr:hypothetical protein BDN72DRAFT_163501 [Pluteus cervinus]